MKNVGDGVFHTLMLELACASRLILILLAQLIEELGQPRVGSRNHATVRVIHVGVVFPFRSPVGSKLHKLEED